MGGRCWTHSQFHFTWRVSGQGPQIAKLYQIVTVWVFKNTIHGAWILPNPMGPFQFSLTHLEHGYSRRSMTMWLPCSLSASSSSTILHILQLFSGGPSFCFNPHTLPRFSILTTYANDSEISISAPNLSLELHASAPNYLLTILDIADFRCPKWNPCYFPTNLLFLHCSPF